MTFHSMGRAASASIVSLAMALGLASCSNDYTVAYVYMTTAKTLPHGLVNGYQVDYQTGYLRPLEDSPIDSGGRNTVSLVVAPNNLFLYTINRDDSSVVEVAIGTDGKLYPENTYNITGSLPTAAAIDASGKYLFVTFTYQNGPGNTQLYTPANPGPGGVTVFPIASDNSLCAANGTTVNKLCTQNAFTVNLGRNPVGILASAKNNFVYVIQQDPATSASLLAFSENATTGALTPLPGVTINSGNVASTGFASGPAPIGLLEDTTASHLYVTDQTLNQVATYSIAGSGVPTLLANGTAATDAGPMGMAFDPGGKYLYVVSYTANTIDTYTLGASGQPIRSTVTPSVQAGIGPTCVTTLGAPRNASPTHAAYLYTSNALSNNLTGEQINQTDGSLYQIQGTPFGGSFLPTCAVSVPALPLR